jgi:hemoglobin
METEPFANTIRSMHPKNLDESIDKLARFLSGWLGGPKLYQKKHGSISIPGVHRPFVIDMPEHDAWLKCMEMALVKQDYAQEFKVYLIEQLKFPAGRIVVVNRKNRELNHGR